MKRTNMTDEKGRAAVELTAQAMLFKSIATMNKQAGKREAVKIMLRAQ